MWHMLGKGLGALLGLFSARDKATAATAQNRERLGEAQARLNENEIAGAPRSRLRLWRSFLGWTLSLLFAWEVAGRLIIIPLCFPQWNLRLPPSALDQVLAVLLGMLGLGF